MSALDQVAELQKQLRFSADIEDIRTNRQRIKNVRDAVQAQLKVIDALAAANRALCTHPNKKTYYDPRDGGGWDCSDCGDSK